MMCYKKILAILIIMIGTLIKNADAQSLNINKDTVSINAETDIQIKFPNFPKTFLIVPDNNLYQARVANKEIIITTKSDNAGAANLVVSEADRIHNFILIFKKDINYTSPTELPLYDYSTVEKLKKHIREAALRKLKEPEKAKISEPVKTDTKPDSTLNYYALLEEADNYIKQANYNEAKSSLDKAHALRPADVLPIQKLKEISLKIVDNEKSGRQENDKKYITITAQAKSYFDQKKYDLAGDAYKKALELRPADLYATKQLEKINKALLEENEKLAQVKNNSLYNQYISQGETAFNKNQLTDARLAFEQALLLKQNDALSKSRLKLIDEKEKRQKDAEELENNYNVAVQSADKFFEAGDYDNARAAYSKALALIKRNWPADQIKTINKVLADQAAEANKEKQQQALQLLQQQQEKEKQALERNYDIAIQSADKFFKEADYEKAKVDYNKAFGFIKKDWPRDQISAINKIIAGQAAQANAEKRQLSLEADIESKYKALLKNADAEFDKSNYQKAKNIYIAASGLRPAEEHPKERLQMIETILSKMASSLKAKNDSIALAKEISIKYSMAVSNAKFNYRKDSLLKAKTFYEEAAELKPAEEEPKSQLRIIIGKLADIAKQAEINNNYDGKIASADSLVIAKDYDEALNTYKDALTIKPLELYPKKQLKYIQSEITDIAKRKEMAMRQEEERKYTEALTEADKAVAEKRYDDARSAYTVALAIHPDNATAKRRLEIVSYQLEKATAEKLKEEALKSIVPEKKSKKKKS